MRKTFCILVVLFVFASLSVDAQRYMRRGDQAYEREQFMEAITFFKKQYERSEKSDRIRSESAYKIASAYMKLSEPKFAIDFYKIAITLNYKHPQIYFELSEAYLQYQEYDMAISTLETYESLHPGEAKTAAAIARIHRTLETLENPGRYEVEIFALINSGELDFCPFFGYRDYDKLFFTSSRSVLNNPDVNMESGELFTDIYEMERDRRTDSWSVPEKTLGAVNTAFDEGAASLNRRYNILYFSRCEYSTKEDKGCRIYSAKRRSQYWAEVKEVKIPGIPDDISIGHPAISDDECTLYFVADSMLGGYGGKDIYKVSRDRKSLDFGAPQNLGPDVNSEKDDCFPYIRSNDILYFSSEAHGSMGGLDIFKAEQKGPSTYIVENMGAPINSPADDFGIVFKDKFEEGYFTSRRRGGVGKSDIYHFILPGMYFEVSGIVWSKKEDLPLADVKVSLFTQDGKEIASEITDERGQYYFELEKDQIYQIYFEKEPYVPESLRLSTKNLEKLTHFKREVFLDEI